MTNLLAWRVPTLNHQHLKGLIELHDGKPHYFIAARMFCFALCNDAS
jgi:hypothetical protein